MDEIDRYTARLRYALSRYGISEERFNAMAAVQRGRCAICEVVFKDIHRIMIDHDHANGEVRGLLCSSCNRGIGLLRDSSRNALRASRYLQIGYLVSDGDFTRSMIDIDGAVHGSEFAPR